MSNAIHLDRRACYIALAASILFGIAGQLLMKWAAVATTAQPWSAASALRVVVALGVYSLGVLSWIFALRGVKLSVAYSLSSLNYVGIFLGSYWLFAEQISAARIVGAAFILAGVMLVARQRAA